MLVEYLKIGEVAETLQTTVRTIRYYEEQGLLAPYRTDGGTRLYSQQHIDRLKAILHLANNGFSLEMIGLIGNTRQTCASGDEGSQKISGIINSAIIDIEDKIDDLGSLKAELIAARKLVKKCHGCTNPPSSQGCPDCPVNKSLEKIEVLNLLWE